MRAREHWKTKKANQCDEGVNWHACGLQALGPIVGPTRAEAGGAVTPPNSSWWSPSPCCTQRFRFDFGIKRYQRLRHPWRGQTRNQPSPPGVTALRSVTQSSLLWTSCPTTSPWSATAPTNCRLGPLLQGACPWTSSGSPYPTISMRVARPSEIDVVLPSEANSGSRPTYSGPRVTRSAPLRSSAASTRLVGSSQEPPRLAAVNPDKESVRSTTRPPVWSVRVRGKRGASRLWCNRAAERHTLACLRGDQLIASNTRGFDQDRRRDLQGDRELTDSCTANNIANP